jgi:acetyl-CoA carboxylase biotin carboxyl carrier protein
LYDIKAPLVGTIYFSPKPGEPSFVKVGDKIELGQILCVIEAMKIFNEIESEVSGTIRKILIDDSHPVEYGQAIISVEIND